MKRILIVEDDQSLNEGIKMTLEQPGMTLIQVYDLRSARQEVKAAAPNLILLDVNLPDGNGFDFCREVREFSEIPVIFLTANDMELDIVRGLELGGDDYITKPFSLMVLRARVNSVLRRYEKTGSTEQRPGNSGMLIDDLTLNFDQMEFWKGEEPVTLSRTEQKLLKLLVVNRGRTLSREQLLERVWGTEFVEEHALTVTVKRLRDKLGTGRIRSIYGIGYCWVKEES